KNTQTAYLNGIQGYGSIGTINYTNSPKFRSVLKLTDSGANGFIYSRRVEGNEFNFFHNSGVAFLQLFVFENGVGRNIDSLLNIPFGTWLEVGFDIDQTTANIKIFYTNLETGDYFEYNTTLLDTILQASATSTIFSFTGGSFKTKGQVACININEGESICFFQEGDGSTAYDSSGNENDISLIGINVADFHSRKGDVINPALLVYGYERFENDITPGDYIDIIFSNGVARGIIPPGYSLKETIQPNAGFSDTGNTLDDLQITGLETDATYTSVYALVDGPLYDITKTTTEVTQLKIK
ncbi:MAG: hypothetical protein ACXAC7_23820, partial [Candidatus Hodarchaeales archaeon]